MITEDPVFSFTYQYLVEPFLELVLLFLHRFLLFRFSFSFDLPECVAAVKSRPVLHHCVVIFFWSSGIMECTCMVFTFENGVPLMR